MQSGLQCSGTALHNKEEHLSRSSNTQAAPPRRNYQPPPMQVNSSYREHGHDYEFVSPPPKSLECSVCMLTLRDPHIVSCCGYEFCQVCIERVQRDGKPCPLCNEQNFSAMLQKKIVREVNALVIRCPQKELGCEWEGELGQLQQHLNPGAGVSSNSAEGCEFLTIECAYHCGAHLQRRLI